MLENILERAFSTVKMSAREVVIFPEKYKLVIFHLVSERWCTDSRFEVDQ